MSYESIILDEMNHSGLPLAYWPLDEANGTTAYDLMVRAKGAGNDGNYINTPTLDARPGPINREVGWASFNGSDEYVNVGTLGSLGSQMGNGIALEAWLSASYAGMRQNVGGVINNVYNSSYFYVTIDASYTAGLLRGGIFVLAGYGGSVRLYGGANFDTGVSDGGIHHLAATADPSGKAIAIYLDGATLAVTYGRQDTFTSFGNFSHNFFLGARSYYGSPDYFLNGALGRAAVYNYALSEDRVKAHYLAGLNGTADNIRLLMRR